SERLRYFLALTNGNWHVRVCDRARTRGDEPMTFRSPHGLYDILRYALLSQNTRVGPNGFDHRGAFADALRVLSHCFTCDSNQRKQQQFLYHRVVSLPKISSESRSPLYPPVLACKFPVFWQKFSVLLSREFRYKPLHLLAC